jgi:MFS transporter, UMF1 family
MLKAPKLTKEERSWILYDVANSAFILIVVTTLMPIFFKGVAAAGLPSNRSTALWGYTNSGASIILALMAPILGTLADYRGMKKRLFLAFFSLGIVMTFLFPTIGEGMVGYAMAISIIGFVGYSGANLFYDSFLTDITDRDRMDRISTVGYAWGYIGAVAPFVLAFLFILRPELVGGSQTMATRIAFLITAVWWFAFSIPMIRNVHQRHYVPPESRPIAKAFARLAATFRHIRSYRNAFLFLIAYFFYIDGVGTIIKMATSYGTDIGMGQTDLIIVVLAIQVIAFPFAILYGRLAKRYSAKSMLFVGICTYVVITFVGYFLPVFRTMQTKLIMFWFMAFLVGTAQGGIQALSRSFFGALIPKSRAGEFYGFYNIFGKFAAILGPALLGIASDLTGESRYGVLTIAILFVTGGIILIFVDRNAPAVDEAAAPEES